MGSLEIKWRSLGKRDRQHHRFVEIKVRRTTPKGSMENGLDRKPEYSVIVFESIVSKSSDNNRPTTEQNKRSAVSNEKVARAGVNDC